MVGVAPKAFDVIGQVGESEDGAEFIGRGNFVESFVDKKDVVLEARVEVHGHLFVVVSDLYGAAIVLKGAT